MKYSHTGWITEDIIRGVGYLKTKDGFSMIVTKVGGIVTIIDLAFRGGFVFALTSSPFSVFGS